MFATISIKQIAHALGKSERTVKNMARDGKKPWPEIMVTVRGGSHRHYREALLPSDVREAIAKERIAAASIEAPKDMIPRVSAMPPAHSQPVNPPDNAKIEGLAKFQLILAYRQALEAAGWGKKEEAAEAFMMAYNSGRLLPVVFEVLGEVALGTVRSLNTKLKKAGDDYHAICDGRGGWKKHGTTKWRGRSLTEEEQKLFMSFYLNQSQFSIHMAYEATKMTLAKEGKEVAVSEVTFRRWIRDYEKKHAGVVCYARYGEKAWKDKYGSYITRDKSLLKPGQCWVADGERLNFFIQHPKTKKPVRMVLILYYDWASGCPVGWQIMPTENTVSIMAAFRNGVINMGRYPEAVYLDNGKAFKGAYFTKKDSDFDLLNGLYYRVGVVVIHAQPYNGRAKVVERFFEILQDQMERMFPTYCGGSIDTKPAHMHRNEKFHKAWHEARTQGWVPDVREASRMLEAYFKWYAERPSRSLDGRRPVDVLAEGMGQGVPTEQLNWDFLWRRKVYPRNQRVRLWNIDYESDALMNLKTSEYVYAMVDTTDMYQIQIYNQERIYLGEATAVQALHPLARLTGDELEMDRVQQAIKKQKTEVRKTKAQLLELGAPKEMSDVVDALPWNQREAILPPSEPRQIEAPKATEEPLEKAEIIRIETAVNKAKAEITAEPTIPRPAFWESELHHYEWSFAVRYEHGQALNDEDAAFMDYFEKTEEFKTNYSTRFEDLKDLYRNYDTDALAVG